MKSDKRRLVAHLPPSVPAFSEDAFLHPRPAPRPPPRSVSTPNLKVVSSMLSSLNASATSSLGSRQVRRPAKLEPISSTSGRHVILVNSASSSEEEILRQLQYEAPKASVPHSRTLRRTRSFIPAETSVNSPWRENVDAMYTQPSTPHPPTHSLSLPSPLSSPLQLKSPSRTNSLPVTSSSSSSSTTPMAPISSNMTVPRGILKKRLPPPTSPPPSLSPHYSHIPPSPTAPRSPPRSLASLASTPPQPCPSLTPPATPFPPPQKKRHIPSKPPTPPKTYVLPCSSSPEPGFGPGSGSEASDSEKMVRSHSSSSSSSSLGSVHQSMRERLLHRDLSTSSQSSSSSQYSSSSSSIGERLRRSRSRTGSTKSSDSSSGSSVHSKSGLSTSPAMPVTLLIL